MARDHARMQTARWAKEDWRDLRWEAQWAYDAIVSQQALTYVGVLDYRPGRLAVLADGATTRKVEQAVAQLEAARYVVIDRQTEELLIRTYVRHDGVLDRVNMGKAVARAFAKVISLELRQAILAELARHYREHPSLAGWHGIKELSPDVMTSIHDVASLFPSGKA